MLAVDNTRPKCAAGPDGVNGGLIKRIGGASLSGPLAMIIRKSLDESVLPQAWSDANVTCIFKKMGSRTKEEK